jgi:hypothetical protein
MNTEGIKAVLDNAPDSVIKQLYSMVVKEAEKRGIIITIEPNQKKPGTDFKSIESL